VRDVLYCEDCLATVIGIPGAAPAVASGTAASETFAVPPPPVPPRPGGSPGVAFFLGLFPGLGAVYNGEYNKALIHIVVFAAIIVGLSSDPGDGGALTLSLLLAGFVLYMAFDAMRTAKAKSLGERIDAPWAAVVRQALDFYFEALKASGITPNLTDGRVARSKLNSPRPSSEAKARNPKLARWLKGQ